MISIPAHMQKVTEAHHYYGELIPETDESGKVLNWIITGEPVVAQYAKRIFPGSSGRGIGNAKFPNNRRNIEDLNWFMLRYPLRMSEENQNLWDTAYEQSLNYALTKIKQLDLPSIEVPSLEFKGELREFQKEGLAFLCNNERTLLADEMGLGKTIQALAYLSKKKHYPAVIVAPPHLIRNWEKEINKFVSLPPGKGQQFLDGTSASSVHVIKGLKPYDLPDASIYLIHYLLLRGWKRELPQIKPKAVIFDEIQELRHGQTEKYSAASLLSQSAQSVIGLSGTPIYNRGGEMWYISNILEYNCLGDWDSFTREWCYGYGSDIVREPEVLGDYLRREGLMLRRKKSEVLKELPPKNRVLTTVEYDEHVYLSGIRMAVEVAKKIDQTVNPFERGRMIRDAVNDTRQAVGLAKAQYVANFVKMLLDAGEKVLLFAHHHAVFDEYLQHLEKFDPVEITGRENLKQKEESVTKFMNGDTNICIISLRAAAGLNLQRATCVCFGELDWSPAVHSQAEDRAHRMGQEDSILCYYLVAEEGTDEAIQEFLGLKIEQFNGIVGDAGETQEDKEMAQVAASEHMKKIIDKLKTK